MKALLFEQFWALLVLGVIASAIVLFGYYQRQTPQWRRAVQIVLPLFCLLLVINRLVVTDREAIKTTTMQLIAACKADDTDQLEPLIDESFYTDGLTKDALLVAAKASLASIKIDRIVVTDLKIDPAKRQAVLRVYSTLSGQSSNAAYGTIDSQWQLIFAKRQDGGGLRSVTCLKLGQLNINSLNDILRQSRVIE